MWFWMSNLGQRLSYYFTGEVTPIVADIIRLSILDVIDAKCLESSSNDAMSFRGSYLDEIIIYQPECGDQLLP